MRVYLVQHGKAMSKDDDIKRPLSSEGIEETKAVAEALKGIEIERIFHSGKLRAQETSEIFEKFLCTKHVAVQPGMNPKDDPEELIASFTQEAMYIGHLPHLKKVMEGLGSGNGKELGIQIVNSGVICIEKKEEEWQLLWYITPKLIQK